MAAELVRHLKFGTIALLSCWATVLLGLALIPSAPGPHLSGGVSFNEKAKWLRRHLADHRCDVVVLGSSIALNSFEAGNFSEQWSGKVVNTGFWGMTALDGLNVLAAVLQRCTPKLVIMPTFYGDFGEEQGAFDWPGFRRYMNGGLPTVLWSYARDMDITYYALNAANSLGTAYRERRMYQSLAFDRIGSVLFACQGFLISPQRWNGYLSIKALPQPRQDKLDALAEIADRLHERGIAFVVAAVPLRKVAEEHLDTPSMQDLWTRVEQIVSTHGGEFSRSFSADGFDDSLFADFVHLNSCGASRWTKMVLQRHANLIGRYLSKHAAK